MSYKISLKYEPQALFNFCDSELNKKDIIRACKTNGSVYKRIKDDIRFNDDMDICITSVKSEGIMINFMPSHIQEKINIQKCALLQNSSVPIHSKDYVKNNLIDSRVLSNMSDKLKDDSDFMMELLVKYKNNYIPGVVSCRLLNDKVFMKEALKRNGNNLKYLIPYPNMINDRDIVLTAVKENGFAFTYIKDEKLKKDKEIIITSLKTKNEAIINLDEELKDDEELMTQITKTNGKIVKHITPRLRNNRIIMMNAIKNFDNAFLYTCNELATDYEFVKIALDIIINDIHRSHSIIKCSLMRSRAIKTYMEHITNAENENAKNGNELSLLKRKDIVIKILMIDGKGLEFLIPEFRNDFEVVETALKYCNDELQYASWKMKNCPRLMTIMVEHDIKSLEYIGNEITKNKQQMMDIVKSCVFTFKYANYNLRNDEEFVVHTLLNGSLQKLDKQMTRTLKYDLKEYSILKYIGNDLKNDEEFILHLYELVLKNKKRIMKEFGYSRIFTIADISPVLFDNETFLLSILNHDDVMIRINYDDFLKNMSNRLKTDINFLASLTKYVDESKLFRYVDEKFKNKLRYELRKLEYDKIDMSNIKCCICLEKINTVKTKIVYKKDPQTLKIMTIVVPVLSSEDFNNIHITKCKHVFHGQCINKWFEQRHICPICNQKIEK